ncbi:MAG: hypothetical protein IJ637_09330 [Prevotella sp.]|nr:hypothetical protein [Prevotella sp.]
MKRSERYILLYILLFMAVGAVRAAAYTLSPLPSLTFPKDTTRYGEDDWDDEYGVVKKDTAVHKPRNIAREKAIIAKKMGKTQHERDSVYDALEYVLEGRHKPLGEDFRTSSSWLKNAFMQVGVGVQKITPPLKTYEFGAMPQIQLGGGKVLNRLSTVRLQGHYAWGYEKTTDDKLEVYGLKADYMYDLSSYFDGYSPTRLMNLSAFVGVGGQYSKKRDESGMSGEAHMGLQLRFFTGPHAYFSVEPYMGIGSDQMDVSGKRNWRSTDIFYGINLNYIYFLRSNLSRQSWERMLLAADSSKYDQVSKDGWLESWQQPWFVQLSSGPAMMKSPELGMGQTLGTEMALSGGKWLSQIIGLRASLFQRTNVWRKVASETSAASLRPVYTLDRHNVYQGVRLEALVNPLGFLKTYRWDNQWGLYLAGGFEKGWIKKTQSEPLSCSNFGWGGGINLWYQPEPGLKLFVEPRFMHNEYQIPYTNIDKVKRYGDDNLTISLGVAVEQRDSRFYSHSFEREFIQDRLRTWTVGGGLGLNFVQTEGGYTGGAKLSYNAMVFGEYHFDRLKGVRLGVEYVGLNRTNMTRYTDYNMSTSNNPEGHAPVELTGLWEHHYGLLLVSPGGMVDMNQLMMDYRPQRLRMSLFAGPTVAMVVRCNSEISPDERVMWDEQPHRVVPLGDAAGKLSFGAHLGFKLQYELKPNLVLHFTPTAYSLITTKLAGVDFTTLKLMETINIGAQYSF